MDNFKEELAKYISKVKENPLVTSVIFSEEKGVKDLKTKEIILNPTNERELKIANALFDQFVDILYLTINAAQGNVKITPAEDNYLIVMFTKIIKAYFNGEAEENIQKMIKEYTASEENTCERSAEVVFDCLATLSGDTYNTVETIIRNCDLDPEDDFDMARFQLFFEKASAKLSENDNTPTIEKLEDMSDEDIQKFVDYAAAFHKKCEESILDKEDFTRSLRLFDLF